MYFINIIRKTEYLKIKTTFLIGESIECVNRKSSDHLSCYLTQLSQPPEAKSSPTLSTNVNVTYDNKLEYAAIDESKTIDKIYPKQLATEQEEHPSSNKKPCKEDYEAVTYKKDYIEEKSVQNLEILNSDIHVESIIENDKSFEKTNSLSNQIRKLSDVVQNEPARTRDTSICTQVISDLLVNHLEHFLGTLGFIR